YGYSTRLLDLTSNILVALYFATDKDPEEEGEIVVLDIPNDQIKYDDSDVVSILSAISLRKSDFSIDQNDSIEEFNKKKDITRLIHDIRGDKPGFLAEIDPT
ncbi:FRG domain-containing protein, partial [Neisseria sp. P0014.S004]